jgi:hypothetical protein
LFLLLYEHEVDLPVYFSEILRASRVRLSQIQFLIHRHIFKLFDDFHQRISNMTHCNHPLLHILNIDQKQFKLLKIPIKKFLLLPLTPIPIRINRVYGKRQFPVFELFRENQEAGRVIVDEDLVVGELGVDLKDTGGDEGLLLGYLGKVEGHPLLGLGDGGEVELEPAFALLVDRD